MTNSLPNELALYYIVLTVIGMCSWERQREVSQMRDAPNLEDFQRHNSANFLMTS